ncbi:hypothetical protein L3X38_017721 [Prunus dulcis]|uniref:Retrotransposon gag domain-containing protein n=1 Tax=Prunus dulcis TaxID=3755 RepID=A0AAD4W7M4_PRUDU|nr:hypothetical protein L3X38_017721 [Prunus dulcis]
MIHIKTTYPKFRKRTKWLQDKHNSTFIQWLHFKVQSELNGEEHNGILENLRWLATYRSMAVPSYMSYLINGIKFNTKAQDDVRTVQNSGVYLLAHTMHVASAKDKNLIVSNMSFYGVIQEIWHLDYQKFRIPVLRCDLIDSTSGLVVDELGFTLIDLSKIGHRNDQFVMASQVKQIVGEKRVSTELGQEHDLGSRQRLKMQDLESVFRSEVVVDGELVFPSLGTHSIPSPSPPLPPPPPVGEEAGENELDLRHVLKQFTQTVTTTLQGRRNNIKKVRELEAHDFFDSADPVEADNWLTNIDRGSMSVLEYEHKFNELSRFAPELIPTEEDKRRCFEEGLWLDIQAVVTATTYPTMRALAQ